MYVGTKIYQCTNKNKQTFKPYSGRHERLRTFIFRTLEQLFKMENRILQPMINLQTFLIVTVSTEAHCEQEMTKLT
jgi:GTP-sensing pleiotropic transcriptional regulator CodY